MRCPGAIFYLLLAFFGYFSPPLYAQINLKTGYNFSFVANPALDRLISTYNQSKQFTVKMKDLWWLHGFEGGFRIRDGIHALELTYQGDYKTLKATEEDDMTGEVYTDRLKFSIQSAAIGYQLGEGFFAIGTDVQYQWYSIKYVQDRIEDVRKSEQTMVALKFYLSGTLQGQKGIDMAIQPYMILPVKYVDLEPLAHNLGVEQEVGKDKWIRYGITLLFYNGAK